MRQGSLILVIEDEPNTRRLMQVILSQNGYECVCAPDGVSGVAATFERDPDAVLLDLGLPDIDGVEVTRRIRERHQVPIIVVSARGREADKVQALDHGANDYVTKPFSEAELLARIRVATRPRRSKANLPPESGTLEAGDLRLDIDLRRLTVAGTLVHVTPTEFRLLATMLASPGRVFTHQQLLRCAWGASQTHDLNHLRVYMTRLRHKVEREPARPRYLVSEPGVGYRLNVPNEAPHAT